MSQRLQLAAFLGLLVSVVFLGGLQRSSVDWGAYAPSTCVTDGNCFCEQDRGGPIRQPSNTWSCFLFVMVGAAIMAMGTEPGANPFRSDPAYPLTFGLIVVCLGLGSMWFHASLTFPGEWADGMSMYLIPSFFIAHNLRRSRLIPPRGFVPVFLFLAAGSGFFLAWLSSFRKQNFALLVAAFILSELYARRRAAAHGDPRLFTAAFFTFMAAFGIWQLDFHRILCSPSSWFQGHAVWHLLCPVSIGLLFLYYRSERAVE